MPHCFDILCLQEKFKVCKGDLSSWGHGHDYANPVNQDPHHLLHPYGTANILYTQLEKFCCDAVREDMATDIFHSQLASVVKDLALVNLEKELALIKYQLKV